MLRIGTGLTGVDLRAQHQVQNAFGRLADSSLKLATLKRINRGADDPAGLIAAEKLNAEIRAIEEASAAAERTRAVIHVADSGLSQSSGLLADIRGNIVAAAGDTLSDEERGALQLEVDAALEALDRIGNYTSFAGKKLLDGEPLEFLAGTDPSDTVTLQLPRVDTGSLGSGDGLLNDLRSGGAASLDGDLSLAIAIVDQAQTTLVTGRAEAGAFERYVVNTTQSVLDDAAVNLSEALSQVQDTDVALESARLVQSQILVDASLSASRLTNFSRRTAAGLLRDVFGLDA